MRRVQVESPYAPRTPLIPGERCACLSVYCGYLPDETCSWHRRKAQRAEESARHARYLAACLRDCIERGETPYASHAILTLPGVLRDDVPEERERGIAAGFAMRRGMQLTAIYINCYEDEWYSRGMHAGIADAMALGVQVSLGQGPAKHEVETRRLSPAQWDSVRGVVPDSK